MAKVSIVGVEGSGKTVLMAVLGEKYQIAGEDGVSLEPLDFETMQFCLTKVNEMRQGGWPLPSLPDEMLTLEWNIRRRSGSANPVVGTLSSLDFGGEVYRAAFGGGGSPHLGDHQDEVAALKKHIAGSESLVVLVNLTDIVNANLANKQVLQTIWSTKSILVFAAASKVKRVAIALSQYDRYRNMVETCGSPAAALRQYLPLVANVSDGLPLFTLTAVNKVVPGKSGQPLPAPDFASEGLDALVDWMLDGNADGKPDGSENPALPLYRVIDLANGTVSGLDAEPSGGWTDEHKTSKIVLRRIDPGTFTMGSPKGEEGRDDDENEHRVTLTKPYYIGVFEVTQGQWQRVMGPPPSRFHGVHRPVEQVSWDDCQTFCQKAGNGLRLPTEAEWECACRAGSTTAYSWGNALNGDRANCDGNAPCGMTRKGPHKEETTDVGSYAPNAWGLYDMHGNVWEWCADWYGEYGGGATDPKGPASGVGRVNRGGGWNGSAYRCRSAHRSGRRPGYRIYYLGFRLCCSAESLESHKES